MISSKVSAEVILLYHGDLAVHDPVDLVVHDPVDLVVHDPVDLIVHNSVNPLTTLFVSSDYQQKLFHSNRVDLVSISLITTLSIPSILSDHFSGLQIRQMPD